MTRTSVREYLSRQRERYQRLRRSERTRLVTEIVAVTGYHRKAVLRCLRAIPRRRAGRRPVGNRPAHGPSVFEIRHAIILVDLAAREQVGLLHADARAA